MEIGDTVLIIERYKIADDLLEPGDVLIIDRFSKKDWNFNRVNKNEDDDEWYLSFEGYPGDCWSFPNIYMKLHKRGNNLKILLDEDRR